MAGAGQTSSSPSPSIPSNLPLLVHRYHFILFYKSDQSLRDAGGGGLPHNSSCCFLLLIFRGIPITFVLRVHIQTEFERGICRAVICLGRVPIVRFLVNMDVKGEEGFVHEQQNSAVLRDG